MIGTFRPRGPTAPLAQVSAQVLARRLVLGLSLALAACTGGNDEVPSLEVVLAQHTRDAVVARLNRPPPQARVPLTRAALDTVEGAYIEVYAERRAVEAHLPKLAERHDDLPGQIVTWRTTDNITLTMRDGILIATRGFGGSILSSSVQIPSDWHSGEKVHYVRDLDNKQRRVALACERVDLGPETLEIVETRYPTRHLQERCEGGGGTVVNDYWVDSRTGYVWQSRQWAGPYIGYLRIRQLTI